MNSKNSMVAVLTIAAIMFVGGMVAMISVSDADARCNNLSGRPITDDWKCWERIGGPGGDAGNGGNGAANGDNNVNSGNGGDGGNGGNGGDANGDNE
jgi:hypothetical protein